MEQNSKKKGVNQLNSLINPLNLLVHPEGFGPPTPGFEVPFLAFTYLHTISQIIDNQVVKLYHPSYSIMLYKKKG